jgi:acetyltransferase
MRPLKTLTDLAPLLSPRSIAVFGASDTPSSIGGRVVRLLQKFKYPGDIWPVNPQRETVAGLRCYKGPEDLPGPADLAVLAIAVDSIAEMVRRCAAAGVKSGIVLANGFAEAGPEGAERQRKLTGICEQTGFNLCGPNCLGIVNSWQPMIATFSAALVEADTLMQGSISMVSQSGGTASTTQALANREGVGLRYIISTGNEAVLQIADYVSALVDDEGTKVIAVYLEGCYDGPRLVEAFNRARDAGKPVVVLKAGMSPDSARAATAHTGVLAGEGRVWEAIFRETGVIVAETHHELLDICLYLNAKQSRIPQTRNTAIVVFGGGYGVLCADLCARNNLALPSMTPESIAKIKPLVPPGASVANPFDLTPQANNHPDWLPKFPLALDVIDADPNIDTIFFQLGAMGPPTAEVVRVLSELRAKSSKAIVVAWMLGGQSFIRQLTDQGLHIFHESPGALRTLDKVIAFSERQREFRSAGTAAPAQASTFDWTAQVPDAAAGMVVSEHDCHRILAAAGLPVAAGKLAVSEDEAVATAEAIGYPVAMKGISPKVTHRAVVGLVALDARSADDVRREYRRLQANAAKIAVSLDGVYVQHMEAGKLELLISSFRDPVFGTMVTCGAGGNLAELIDDVVLERAPINRAQAMTMLGRLKLVQRLEKIDREADIVALADFIVRFSALSAAIPWPAFVLEINPVKWRGNRVVAVDGLLLINRT